MKLADHWRSHERLKEVIYISIGDALTKAGYDIQEFRIDPILPIEHLDVNNVIGETKISINQDYIIHIFINHVQHCCPTTLEDPNFFQDISEFALTTIKNAP